MQKLLENDTSKIYDNLPAVVSLIEIINKKQLSDGKVEFSEKDVILIKNTSLWMEALMLMIDKENKYS